jgi:hypothetical protein
MNKFLFIFYISFFCINNFIAEIKANNIQTNNSNPEKIKKTRKVDISILRENLVSQLIELLQLVEKALNIILKDSKKESFTEQSNEVMHIFSWINKCITRFNEDPSSAGRSEIESYLNQAQKYKLFLNNI